MGPMGPNTCRPFQRISGGSESTKETKVSFGLWFVVWVFLILVFVFWILVLGFGFGFGI